MLGKAGYYHHKEVRHYVRANEITDTNLANYNVFS